MTEGNLDRAVENLAGHSGARVNAWADRSEQCATCGPREDLQIRFAVGEDRTEAGMIPSAGARSLVQGSHRVLALRCTEPRTIEPEGRRP